MLRDAGWDVYRLDRPPQGETPDVSSAALLSGIAELKARGYRKIVLAGQSAGAWISLITAGRTSDVYAVIANAPAYYGVDRPRYTMNASALYDYLDRIKSGRVMVSYFADDPYDPGGRGARTDEILTRHGVLHLVIDTPEGFRGHDSGNSGLFYRRFGPCVLAMVGDGPVPQRGDCETRWGQRPSGELTLPTEGLASASGNTAAAPFLGPWWGIYTAGREVFLGLTAVTGDSVEAIYAVGPLPAGAAKTETSHRAGRIAGDTLEFAEPGKSTLRYRLRADHDLDAFWIAADGKSHLETVLRHPP